MGVNALPSPWAPSASRPGLLAAQAVMVHPPEVREPVPLSIHHLPLPISFALWEVRATSRGEGEPERSASC